MSKPPNLKKLREEKSRIIKIKLNCMGDVDDLIQELRDQKAKAKRTAGTYYVGRKNIVGGKVADGVEFEIGFRMGECGR